MPNIAPGNRQRYHIAYRQYDILYSFLIPTQIKYVRKTETWWGAQGGGEGYVLSISTNLATFISASQYSSIRGKTIN